MRHSSSKVDRSAALVGVACRGSVSHDRSTETPIISLNSHVRESLVTGYEPLIGGLTLPDPDDRHVLAAAILSGADTIVGFNLKDFPEEALKPYDSEAQHPDEFLNCQLDLAPNVVCAAAKKQRGSLKNPPMNVEEYLASLERLILIAQVEFFWQNY